MDDTETTKRSVFQRVARAELGRLYGLARHLDRDRAEDLVQECLLRGYRSFHTLRDPDAAGGWLRMILTNVWRDTARRDRRTPSEVPMENVEEFSLFRTLIDEDPLPYSDSLHLDFLGCLEAEDVRAVLQRLSDRYRAPLVLRYVEGLSTKEVAEALDLPFGTVLSQLHRGRNLFERELWRYAEETGALGRAPARSSAGRGKR